MALGFNYSDNAGGDFLPFVKYDARSGRIFRRDREDGASNDVDITRNFKAVMDLENVEVGWIDFNTGSAPSYSMVKAGNPFPAQPTPNHKKGSRTVIKLSKECGGDIREISSNAKAFGEAFDRLHDAYLEGLKANAGKLPVVAMVDAVPKVSGTGAQKSTNYVPVFEIVSWVNRPEGMNSTTRVAAAEPAARATPPSTGSSRPATVAKVADPDDFG